MFSQQILTQDFILTVLMLTGVVLTRLGVITREATHWFSALLVNVALPCTIIGSFHFDPESALLTNAAIVFGISVAVHAGLIALSRSCYGRMASGRREVFVFATVFSNCGFVGIPFAQGLFGDIGVFYVSIFTIPFNVLMFTYGVSLFRGTAAGDAWRGLANPPLIGTLIGLALFLASVHLPEPVTKTVVTLGNMTTPLSMVIIGAFLAETRLVDVLKDRGLYFLGLVKLVVAPLLLTVVLTLVPVDRTVAQVCIVLVAMPSASLVGVFAQRYGGDAEVAARGVFMTTVLSVATVPLILALPR
jgi:malate permease and related proteins